MKDRRARRRRGDDHMLDVACLELHQKLMCLGDHPMTTMEYLSSMEFAAISIAAARAKQADEEE